MAVWCLENNLKPELKKVVSEFDWESSCTPNAGSGSSSYSGKSTKIDRVDSHRQDKSPRMIRNSNQCMKRSEVDTQMMKPSDSLVTSEIKISVSPLTSDVGEVEEAEVINSEGTKGMSRIKCPTVLIKVHNIQLAKARVHYVLLEPKNGKIRGQIPALLLSNPWDQSKTSQTAELLPLVMHKLKAPAGAVSLKPMLLFKRYKFLFKETCGFLLTVLKLGRQFSPLSAKMLKMTVFKDIQMMPKDALRELKPLRKRHRVKSKSMIVGPQSMSEGPERSSPRRLSEIFTDLRLPGLKVCGGNRNFGRWFATIPPNTVVNANFRCDDGIFHKDTFQDPRLIDCYLGLSQMM